MDDLIIIILILPSLISCEGKKEVNLIVGGEMVDIRTVPYQVSFSAGGHFCGGSLILSDVVLTAAHCFDAHNGGHVLVEYGTTVIGGGRLVKAKKIRIHESYTKDYQSGDYESYPDHDIAVMSLVRKIPLLDTVRTIQFAKNGDRLATGDLLTVSGWGKLQFDNSYGPENLYMVKLNVINWEKCKEVYNGLTPSMFCTWNKNKDACSGDSGGPAVLNNIQYGIVSFGEECATDEYPGVFTKVSYFSSWIQDAIKLVRGRPGKRKTNKTNSCDVQNRQQCVGRMTNGEEIINTNF